MRHGDWAWITLAGGICAYEAWAAIFQAELLSEAVDRYRRRYPVLTYTVIGLLAAHLARLIPSRWDPLHRITTWQ